MIAKSNYKINTLKSKFEHKNYMKLLNFHTITDNINLYKHICISIKYYEIPRRIVIFKLILVFRKTVKVRSKTNNLPCTTREVYFGLCLTLKDKRIFVFVV